MFKKEELESLLFGEIVLSCPINQLNPRALAIFRRSNGLELMKVPLMSNVGTDRLPPLTCMMTSAAPSTSSMLISSYSMPASDKNRLAARQSPHRLVV
jgi:hypothetical protein